MMKELFNLHKFEFYYQVVSLESKNNDRKKYVEGQLQQLEYACPEQAVRYESELNDLSEAIEELDRKLGESIKNEESLRNLQELTQKREKQRWSTSACRIRNPPCLWSSKKKNQQL